MPAPWIVRPLGQGAWVPSTGAQRYIEIRRSRALVRAPASSSMAGAGTAGHRFSASACSRAMCWIRAIGMVA